MRVDATCRKDRSLTLVIICKALFLVQIFCITITHAQPYYHLQSVRGLPFYRVSTGHRVFWCARRLIRYG